MPGQRGPSIWLQGVWPLKPGTYTTEYFNPFAFYALMWTVVDSDGDSLSSGVPLTPAVGGNTCLLPFGPLESTPHLALRSCSRSEEYIGT
jgi:hypothetical protein